MLTKYRKVIYLLVGFFLIGSVVGWWQSMRVMDLSTVLSECSKDEGRAKYISCISSKIRSDLIHKTTRELMTELEEIVVTQVEFVDNPTLCHDVSHAIGQAGGKSEQVSLGVTLSQCSPICTAGCYHGVIEGYVSKIGEINEELMSVCDRRIFSDNVSHEACLHGLGHGVVSIQGNELVKALKMCDLVEEEYRTYCGAGVIMELYEPGSFEHARLPIPDDIPSMCEPMWDDYRKLCFEITGSHELGRSGNLDKAVSTCKQLDTEYQVGCAIAIGTHMLHSNNWKSEQNSIRCDKFVDESLFLGCIKGIVAASNNSDPERKVSRLLCQEYQNELTTLCKN